MFKTFLLELLNTNNLTDFNQSDDKKVKELELFLEAIKDKPCISLLNSVLSKKNVSALMLACRFKYIKCAELLILKKADVTFQSDDRKSAFLYCCKHSNVIENDDLFLTLDLLLQHTADVNQSNRHVSPLQYACQNGNLNLTQYLLDKGADINLCGQTSWTGLMFACHRNHAHIVELLLNLNADASIFNKNGQTALHICCYKSSIDSLKFLLTHRYEEAYINAFDNDGYTPLRLALFLDHSDDGDDDGDDDDKVKTENNIQTMKLLLSAKADASITDENGNTALHICCYPCTHIDILKLILKHTNGAGIDINAVNNDNWTPLMVACDQESDEDSNDTNGNTLLQKINLLLSANADASITDENGNTALNLSTTKDIHLLIEETLSEKYILK
jgi:ankyrin repeat protein